VHYFHCPQFKQQEHICDHQYNESEAMYDDIVSLWHNPFDCDSMSYVHEKKASSLPSITGFKLHGVCTSKGDSDTLQEAYCTDVLGMYMAPCAIHVIYLAFVHDARAALFNEPNQNEGVAHWEEN